MRIEELGEDDWAAFREVRLRSLLDAPDAFGSTYGEESSQTERGWRDWAAGRWRGGVAAVYLGRDDEERPTGTITVAEFDAEPGIAHVYAMWVAPDARRAGVGRALIDAAAAWARGRGCHRLVLSVTETNAPARSFYEAVGFVDTGERKPLREGSELEVIRLAKRL
ncbi:MAG TPA: GNAT family N-acetyltransferase [Actinomycetota bacterium]